MSIEEKARRRRRKENIQRAVLATIQIAGVLAIAAVAPNVLQVFPGLSGNQRSRRAYQAKTAVGRLLAGGYLARDGGGAVRLTEKGERRLAIETARSASVPKMKPRWDGRYRMVMFDISQRRRSTRDRLRSLMVDFGFLRIQDSVWVFPYDCEDLVTLVKAELRIGHDVLYAVVDHLSNDQRIKTHFKLE